MLDNQVPNRKLKHERERRGLSQQRLAELLGTSFENISRWERGVTSPQPHFREKLCKLFKKDAAELGLIVQEVSSEVISPLPESVPGPETLETSHTTSSLHARSDHPTLSRPPTIMDNALTSQERKRAKREDWAEAPHVRQMYGRGQELQELQRWILDDHVRLTALFGMGGIGKTTLAVAVADLVKSAFDLVFWRSLHNAPPLERLLQDCITFVSDRQRTDLPEDQDEQISLLMSYLREHRCLLIVDNFETTLQSGKGTGAYREGYEGYGKLLQRIGESKHVSCLLLTSREKPHEVALFEGGSSPVRSRRLEGLGPSYGREILREKGLHGEDDAWEDLVTHYGGNPLSLKLVAQFILELFEGDIARFLAEGDMLVSDVNYVLDQQFERLSTLEQKMMYWLAVEREALSLKAIQEDMADPLTIRSLQEALGSLRRRDLLEVEKGRFALQNVILEYATERFIDRVYDEIVTGPIMLLESHALMKAQTKDYVRESQERLILAPTAQRLLTTFGKEVLESKLKHMLALLQKRLPQRPGYTAGNILNLLIHLRYDLRGYDFSRLTIRQAWLQEAELPQVNFSHAAFEKCSFSETFGDVLSVAFHPSGDLIATGTANNEIRVWQAESGVPLLICQGHTDWVYAVAYSPDGRLLASGSYDRAIRLWDAHSGQALVSLRGHTNGIRSVTFSPDGKLLASSGDDQTVRVWDIQTGQALQVLQGDRGWVRAVAFSPDGQLLASGNDDHTISIWEVGSGACVKTLHGHERWVQSVAFSPDGRLLATGSGDRSIRLWDINSGTVLAMLQGHSSAIWCIAFSPDGRLLASGGDDQTVRLWETNREETLQVLQRHSGSIRSIAFSPDGKTLISGSSDQSARLWDVSTGKLLQTLQGHSSVIWSTAWHPTEEVLASSGSNRNIHLWDASTGHLLKTLRGHSCGVWSVAFSSDGKLLASSGDDQSIRLWDVRGGRALKTLRGHGGGVRAIAFSPDGSLLASGSDDRSVRLWEVTSGIVINVLTGHGRWVRAIAFSPDGKTPATGSGDQTVRLWDVATGQFLRVLQDHLSWVRSVAFSPDGNMIASGCGDQAIRLWDARTGQLLEKLQMASSGIRSVAFSPDGQLLAAGYQDLTVRIWDIHTCQMLGSLLGHTSGGVWCVSFSPNGVLATGGDDGAIKLWERDTGACLQTLRSDEPYEGMNITGAQGLTEAQKAAILALGGFEER